MCGRSSGGCRSASPPYMKLPTGSAAFELRDEEDFAALADLLEIGRLVVNLAVNRDRGLLLKVLAEPRMEPVERLDHVAHRRRLDIELALAAGIAAGEPARQDDVRGHRDS